MPYINYMCNSRRMMKSVQTKQCVWLIVRRSRVGSWDATENLKLHFSERCCQQSFSKIKHFRPTDQGVSKLKYLLIVLSLAESLAANLFLPEATEDAAFGLTAFFLGEILEVGVGKTSGFECPPMPS